jgi:hypothetical protein
VTEWRNRGYICIGRGSRGSRKTNYITQGLKLADDHIVAVLSACFGVRLRCRGSICQGLQVVSDFGEGSTKFFCNFLKFFLVQFI